MEKLLVGTVNYLKIMSSSENQFIQIINTPHAIINLVHIINVNLMRAVDTLNRQLNNYSEINLFDQNTHIAKMHADYYISTIMELSQLYMGTIAGTIVVNKGFIDNQKPNDQWITYDPAIHGYKPMGNVLGPSNIEFFYVDYSVLKVYTPDDILRYNVDPETDFGDREVFIRLGNSHIDSEFSVPDDGHKPYVAIYIQVDELEFPSVLGGITNDIISSAPI